MLFAWRDLRNAGLLVAIGWIAAGCTDERIVFRDRDLFEEPPAGAANFLGYSDQDNKLTVCGNCHVGAQSQWEETVHADAWASLQGSGHAQTSCEGCHSVGADGNPTSGMAGYAATQDTRYHDVQCESCHGPGLDHVENPNSGNLPLATMIVATDGTSSCGECHAGTHHPFVEEWGESLHAAARSAAVGRADCEICHVGEVVLQTWGVNANYAEKDSLLVNPGASMGIGCAVCHDPHEKTFQGQLRFAVDDPTAELNLCMRCHNRRANPEPTSSRGPHAPEGPTLLGEAGWFPPNFEYAPGTIVSTHGSDANPRLCATCHVANYEITDAATGSFVFNTVGHLFEAIPCVDAQGVPQTGTCGVTERTFKSCAAVGCHTEVSARSAYIAAEGRIELLTNALATQLAKIPAAEFNTGDGRYTTGEGAKFNLQLALIPGSKFHNPFLIEALIAASVKQITLDYGITSPAGLSLETELNRAVR